MPVDTLNILRCFKVANIKCNPLKCVCCGRGIPQRLILTCLIMYSIIVAYTQRVCFNIAITEMTVPRNTSGDKVSPDTCKATEKSFVRPVIDPIEGGKYDWDEETQSFLLLSFFIGYLFLNIPAGYLCDRYGSKWIVVIGMAISTICTGLIPLATIYISWHVVVGLRLLTGLGQAGVYPAATALMARWIPNSERSCVGGVVLSALSIGTIVGNIPSAYILNGLKSWVWVFYFYAFFGAVFVVIAVFFMFSTPQGDPYITTEESAFLENEITVPEKHKVPIKAILSDTCVWACIINQFGNDYCLFTVITNFPKYLNDVLKVSSQYIGFIVCAPQVAMFISSFVTGAITDALVQRAGFRQVTMRVVNTMIATMGPCFMLLLCCMLRCNTIGAVAAISFGMVMKAGFYSGMKVTIIDITKYHTGLVAAIVNAAGGLAGAIAPYTIGQVAVDNSFAQWDTVSLITIGIAAVSLLPYCLFCKAERRDWDYIDGVPQRPEGWKTNKSAVLSWVNRT